MSLDLSSKVEVGLIDLSLVAFTCPATGCHRKFSVRSNMSRHIRNVHQSWPYDNDGDFECSNDGAEEPDDARRY